MKTRNYGFVVPAKLVGTHGNVRVYKRQLNQTAHYFLVHNGDVIGVGKRKSISRRFNAFRGATNRPMEYAMSNG